MTVAYFSSLQTSSRPMDSITFIFFSYSQLRSCVLLTADLERMSATLEGVILMYKVPNRVLYSLLHLVILYIAKLPQVPVHAD